MYQEMYQPGVTDELINRAKTALKNYEKALRKTEREGEPIYHLMMIAPVGPKEEHPSLNKMVLTDLLAALAKPKFNKLVSDEIGEYNLDILVELLPKLMDFYEAIGGEQIQTELLRTHIKNWPQEYDKKDLERIIEAHERKIKGVRPSLEAA